MHILDGFLDASPSLWMVRTIHDLCLAAALLTGCWCFTRSLERRIQAQLQGSRIKLGAQLQDLERKITAILDELRQARALSQVAPGTCGPARLGMDNGSPNELSGSSGTRKSLQPSGPKAWPGPLIERRRSAKGKSAASAMENGGSRRAGVLLRCGEGLAAAEGAWPMLSRGRSRGASVSGGMLTARQADTETLALSTTLPPRVKPLASTHEHAVQVMSSRPESCGSLKRTASVSNDSVQVAQTLLPEGKLRPLPAARKKTHGYSDLASTIAGPQREPDVFKRPPSGRSREDFASSIIRNTGSPGQRWRPLELHEHAWKSMRAMRPEIITRTSSQPSSGRAPDDKVGLAGNRISLTPPTGAFATFALSRLAPKVKTTKSVDSPLNSPPVQVTSRGLLKCGDSSCHGTLYSKGITRRRRRSTDDGILTSCESLLDLQW